MQRQSSRKRWFFLESVLAIGLISWFVYATTTGGCPNTMASKTTRKTYCLDCKTGEAINENLRCTYYSTSAYIFCDCSGYGGQKCVDTGVKIENQRVKVYEGRCEDGVCRSNESDPIGEYIAINPTLKQTVTCY